MGTTTETRITSTQAKDAIYKAHSISSSASEIDNGVLDIRDIKYFKKNKQSVIPSTWELGGLSDSGVELVYTNRCRSNYIDISILTGSIELLGNIEMYRINQYDSNYKHISQVSTPTKIYSIALANVKYIRITSYGIVPTAFTVLNNSATTYDYVNVFVKKASHYGFHPLSSASVNTAAINTALAQKGKVIVDIPGDYNIDSSMIIGDNTELEFGLGVNITRTTGTGYVLVNSGAFTKTYNKNIKVKGLNVICNGFNVTSNKINGLTGHISFFYVKDLEIINSKCEDLASDSFFLHICTFEDLKIDGIKVFGNKDGIHLGKGKRFKISNGIFKTYDDPIALNGHDYDSSNPQLGWIEDGIIENCYDLNDTSTTGFFCRILAGAWVDWFSGMSVQKSDTVVNNGRMYRVVASLPDGTTWISTTAPTHTTGSVVLNGINWVMVQDDDITYTAGVRNIHFKNIFLKKNRGTVFSFHLDNNNWSRSFYQNAQVPIQDGFIFENIYIQATINTLISSVAPIGTFKIINSELGNTKISLDSLSIVGLSYPKANILSSGNTFKGSGSQKLIEVTGSRTASFKAVGSIKENSSYTPTFDAAVTVVSSDI